MSKFGWSYPAGAANDPNAPWNQEDGPCAVCCMEVECCICPECPVCQQNGDPKCYAEHGMKLRREQVIGRQEMKITLLQGRVNDEKFYLEQLQAGCEFSDDIAENPDPFG